MKAAAIIFALACALTYTSGVLAQQGDDEDRTSPMILHQTQEMPVVAGYAVEVGAKVTDNVRVARVQLFYRIPGETRYRTVEMTRRDGDEYAGSIAASDVKIKGLEYFMIARDWAGNLTLLGSATAPVFMTVRSPVQESPVQQELVLAWYQEGGLLSLIGAVVIAAVVAASL